MDTFLPPISQWGQRHNRLSYHPRSTRLLTHKLKVTAKNIVVFIRNLQSIIRYIRECFQNQLLSSDWSQILLSDDVSTALCDFQLP